MNLTTILTNVYFRIQILSSELIKCIKVIKVLLKNLKYCVNLQQTKALKRISFFKTIPKYILYKKGRRTEHWFILLPVLFCVDYLCNFVTHTFILSAVYKQFCFVKIPKRNDTQINVVFTLCNKHSVMYNYLYSWNGFICWYLFIQPQIVDGNIVELLSFIL